MLAAAVVGNFPVVLQCLGTKRSIHNFVEALPLERLHAGSTVQGGKRLVHCQVAAIDCFEPNLEGEVVKQCT